MEEVHHRPKDPVERVLDSIRECLSDESEIRYNSIVIPKWNITIRPEFAQLDEMVAVINFHLSCPEWDEPLFECCAACAKDADRAIGMALGSFMFGFMHGIMSMQNDDVFESLESSFVKNLHRWSVYTSNNVGMGESIGEMLFWDLLKDHIVKRLGDQKMCYVKVFASKAIGKSDVQVTGEVRINDIPSRELSKIIEDAAAEWNVEQFSSQKQFFFLTQDPKTTNLIQDSSVDKTHDFEDKVKIALEMIDACETEEQHQAMYSSLAKRLNDVTLAEELLSFLPEIAAENAFPQIEYSEKILLSIGGAEPIECYKSQLSDYYRIHKTLFSLLRSGVFGERTDMIYRKLIGSSSIYNCVRQLEEKGSKLDDCKLTSLLFNTSNDFEIR